MKTIITTFFLTAVLANLSTAQQQLKLPSIPFPLYWQNTPANYSITGSDLQIESGPKTDFFVDPNATYNTHNAPALVFAPDEDFVLTVKVQHGFTNKWDAGGILFRTDDVHWIKFGFEKDYTGAHRIVSVFTNQVSDDCNSSDTRQNFVYLKLAKAQNVVTLYSSPDGKTWLLVRHLQYNAPGTIQVGFLAQSPEGQNNTVTFSGIKYEHRKISDPYKGE